MDSLQAAAWLAYLTGACGAPPGDGHTAPSAADWERLVDLAVTARVAPLVAIAARGAGT